MDKIEEDESRPFDFKYAARDILKKTLNDLNLSKRVWQHSEVMKLALVNLLFKLGVNYFDSEEYSDAEAYLTKAVELYNELEPSLSQRFVNLYQDMQNHLGITYCNRGSHEKGVPHLESAKIVY